MHYHCQTTYGPSDNQTQSVNSSSAMMIRTKICKSYSKNFVRSLRIMSHIFIMDDLCDDQFIRLNPPSPIVDLVLFSIGMPFKTLLS